MAKKPILTDEDLDGGVPVPPPPPPPPLRASGVAPSTTRASGVISPGATRPVDTSAPLSPVPPSATRPLDAPEPPHEAPGRDASGHARPKTRIHGYGGAVRDETEREAAPITAPVVGWLVVTAGPGRGAVVGLVPGMNAIGRGDDNAVQIDFGDTSISRDAHAYVSYDDEARGFHISHGGKTNLVRLNNAPVLAAEVLTHGDTLRIGATSLRFVALCGADFDWSDT